MIQFVVWMFWFIVPSGGNHPALAGGGSRAPLLKLVYATRDEPQPTQRVFNQLPSGLDTTLSKKKFWLGLSRQD